MQKNKQTPPVYDGAPAGFSIANVTLAKHAIAQTKLSALSTTVPATVLLDITTGFIRITALSFPVIVKFNGPGETAVSALDFDEIIPAGGQRDYVLDSTVELLSLMSVGTAADLYVVEY